MAKVSEAVVGAVFGRLTIMQKFRKSSKLWTRCACECGSLRQILANDLGTRTKSCGCLQREAVAETIKSNTVHGAINTGAYKSWKAMWKRCRSSETRYAAYRNRLPVDAWSDFSTFLSDMGDRPEGTTLEREDNTLGYGPGNCVWATHREQARNRSNTIYVSVEGKKTSLAAACELAGVEYGNTYRRIAKWGWPVSKAFGNNYKEYTE